MPSSIGEGPLGQQPTGHANTTINNNVVDEVLWFSNTGKDHMQNITHRKLYYSQSLSGKCSSQRSSIIFN